MREYSTFLKDGVVGDLKKRRSKGQVCETSKKRGGGSGLAKEGRSATRTGKSCRGAWNFPLEQKGKLHLAGGRRKKNGVSFGIKKRRFISLLQRSRRASRRCVGETRKKGAVSSPKRRKKGGTVVGCWKSPPTWCTDVWKEDALTFIGEERPPFFRNGKLQSYAVKLTQEANMKQVKKRGKGESKIYGGPRKTDSTITKTGS